MLVDRWIEVEVDAGLADWMLECRRIGTTPPKLRLFRFARSKPHKKDAISSGRMRIAAAMVATHQRRPITSSADDSYNGRVLALSVDETAMLDDCRNAPQDGASKVTELNATPRDWACPVAFAEDAGAVVTSVRPDLRAQHEFEFELQKPVDPDLKTDHKVEIFIPHALVESSYVPSDKPPLLHHTSHCFAEVTLG